MLGAKVGDIFGSNAQTLVNTVNCVGVMGKGVALEFKKRFPDMYADYVERCAHGEVRLGEPYLYRSLFPPYVLNFPTKDHWRGVSKLSDIVVGLEFLGQHYRDWGIESLAVPPLGCGHGQLEWRVVGPTLYRHLKRLEIPFELYAPVGTPTNELEESFLSQEASDLSLLEASGDQPKIDPAWIALVEVVARIEREPYHWPTGHTKFQKLAYFATELGVPTGLEYVRGSYGPFAYGLKPLLTKLVNNGLLCEEKDGRGFVIRTGPTYEDAKDVALYRTALLQWEQQIASVADLLLRMDASRAEVAATVHFVYAALVRETAQRPTDRAIFEGVKEWKQRRQPPLQDDDIWCAIRALLELRWIDIEPAPGTPLYEELLIGA